MANIQRYGESIGDAFDRMMEGFYGSTRIPSVDISENEKEFMVKAEIPGIDPSTVNLYVENHALHITHEEKQEDEKAAEGKKYIMRERHIASFERSFSLPEDVDEEAIEAGCKDGVLTVTIPKKAKAEPKKIELKINK